jgi:alpha,alpha-trehalose phosphorylase
MLRPRCVPPHDIFPADPWVFEAIRFDAKLVDQLVGQAETIFALSNGYLGMRGTFEEGTPVKEPGVFLNGFYEHRPISYGEHAYGFPRLGQSMLNCPDGTALKLFVDDEPFVLTNAEILSFRRVLNLRDGTLKRDVRWATPSGKHIRLRTMRLVSFNHRHLAAIEYELTAEDADTEMVISSELANRQPLPVVSGDPRLAEGFVGRVLHPAGNRRDGLRAILSYRTKSSGLVLGCGMDHNVEGGCAFTAESTCHDDLAAVVFKAVVERGKSIRIHKYLAYHYSDDPDAEQIRSQTGWTLSRAIEHGFARILDQQRRDLSRFWSRADVTVESNNPRTQQVIRWNLFQLLQASERAEGHGIGARGLTGQTYEGHYFWDTEIYVLPFLIYSQPRAARGLLKHRYDMLDKARARAKELGFRGATFPWRTINGEEASAYYAAGTAQYHINADIAYALRKYVEVSGDDDFLRQYGAEILVETARFWCDLGFFSERKDGRFCINGVTGPDEYSALVNNNYFTNLMARENLRYATRTVRTMERRYPESFEELVRRTCLASSEPAAWEDAAERMYLPYDERLGVHPQDDDFLNGEKWDFVGTPEDHYPLLLHYHPLNLYRSQVIKQADTVLAMFLLSDQFTSESRKRNFDYYDPLTTHDSSLSVCVQSIVANEIGYRRRAMRYFNFAAVMDLSDVGGNMMHGAHIASIGGTWLALVYGFVGMRDHGGQISFRPRLPDEWSRLALPLMIKGRRLRVDIDHATTTYSLLEGDQLTIYHDGEEVTVSTAAPTVSRPNPLTAVEPEPDFAACECGRSSRNGRRDQDFD